MLLRKTTVKIQWQFYQKKCRVLQLQQFTEQLRRHMQKNEISNAKVSGQVTFAQRLHHLTTGMFSQCILATPQGSDDPCRIHTVPWMEQVMKCCFRSFQPCLNRNMMDQKERNNTWSYDHDLYTLLVPTVHRLNMVNRVWTVSSPKRLQIRQRSIGQAIGQRTGLELIGLVFEVPDANRWNNN